MIRLLLVLLVIILPGAAFARPADPMRGLIWDLPPEAVQAHEAALFVEARDGRFFYMDEIEIDEDYTVKALIEYSFTQKGLAGIRYDFVMEDGHNPVLTMERLMKMDAWLSAAIGVPSAPDFTFRNDFERAHSSRWGWALYRGDATFRFRWQAADTAVLLTAQGRDSQGTATLRLTRLP